MDFVIGVDIGTQSTKALLCDERGTVWVPPRIPDARPKIIAGLALAAAIGATVVALQSRSDDR